MKDVVSSHPDDKEISGEEPKDAAQLIQRLLSFLGDWVDRYRVADLQDVGSLDPEELLIVREAGDSLRKRKPLSIALDEWAGLAYAERRLRSKLFEDPQLFGEPAWDMLLDIALAESKGVRLSVTSVCIGACVPSTTALRWLNILEGRGLIRREDDFEDCRRSFVRLTTESMRKLVRYFEAVRELRRGHV